MRIVLFYSGIESFNYFTDELNNELKVRGCETYIWDLNEKSQDGPHSFDGMLKFCEKGVDAAICFDRLGVNEQVYKEFWNMLGCCVVNILMDPPFRFHPLMEDPPKKYIQFCPDMQHVEYTNKYFPKVERVMFLPHAGTLPDKAPIPYTERKYDILFSGTYYNPKGYVDQIHKLVGDSKLFEIFMDAASDLFANSQKNVEEALKDALAGHNMGLETNYFKSLMRAAEPLDWMVRMHYRKLVIKELLDAGFELYVIGRGWNNFPVKDKHRLNILSDRIPFKETFSYMENAKINLNVMPGFKAGTHDRVFNSLLLKSVCLTDTSSWLLENFTDEEDIAFYFLSELDKLPKKVKNLLEDEEKAKKIAENGYKKVAGNFIWKNNVDIILREISLMIGR